MIYLGSNEIAAIKLGNTDISAIYAGDLLIWPTSVTGWSVTPATIEMEASGGTENITITSLSAWTITSSESWITFSQNSGDSGRTTVAATIASHTDSSARTATITVTDGTNVSTISVSQEAYADYASQYFTMEVLTAGTICFKAGASATAASNRRTIQYSKNNGTWNSITSTTGGTTFSVSAGDVIRFKGTNATYSSRSASTYANTFSGTTAKVKIYGNIMSFIVGDNFQTAKTFSSTYVFRSFLSISGVMDAENLVLPATALTEGCYMGLLADTMISIAPKLPATVLAKSCYWNLFLRCANLVTPSELPAITMKESCYRAMYYGTSITTAPDLSATTLTTSCYYQMFDQCSELNYIKCLATNISATTPLNSWVRGVASSGTFVKAASMSSWPSGNNGIPSGWTVVNNT